MSADATASEPAADNASPERRRPLARSRSYVVSCPSQFRDDVLALADRKRRSPADLARGVMMLLDPEILETYPDPGEPLAFDREIVVVQSGSSKGRRLRRKPRLQLRLEGGLRPENLRRALGLALAMDRGEKTVEVHGRSSETPLGRLEEATEEITWLRDTLQRLLFEPLKDGVRTRADALHVLGFAPSQRPGAAEVREKFRALAKVHHPDSAFGDHQRMAQLNQAMKVLRDGPRF